MFRAVTIALMIFMDHPTISAAIPLFLRHPDWHGYRLPDLVFPAFIFIAGVSLAFSTRRAETRTRAASLNFARREVLLFALGLGLNFFKYGLPLRIMGVLQRISLALAIAWPFTRLRIRWAVIAAAALLIVYSAIFLFVSAPGVPAGSLEKTPSITGWLDTTVFGVEHTYKQSGFDPEGLLGTLPAAALALIGLVAGRLLIERPDSVRQLGLMALVGAGLIGFALLLHAVIPLNKKLWTSSFTLMSAGICLVVLAALYYVVDVKGHEQFVTWLVPMGRNALFLYIASNMFVVVFQRWVMVDVGGETVSAWSAVATWLSQRIGLAGASLAISAAEVTLWFVVAAIMHRRKIYIKL